MRGKQNLIALITMLNREAIRILRIWIQTLLPPVITTSLYFVIFGTLIGQRIGNIHGISYIEYIVPGLIMMSVITNSYMNVVSSFFSSKYQNSIQELLVSPAANITILWGYVSGGIVRGVLSAILVFAISLFFTNKFPIYPGLAILVTFLTIIMFSLAGILNGIFAKKFDDISIIPTFVLSPLTYLGGVFYSIDLLPSFWQKTSLLNPIFYIVNAFRYSITGISDTSITIAIVIVVLSILVLHTWCLWLIKRGTGIRS